MSKKADLWLIHSVESLPRDHQNMTVTIKERNRVEALQEHLQETRTKAAKIQNSKTTKIINLTITKIENQTKQNTNRRIEKKRIS